MKTKNTVLGTMMALGFAVALSASANAITISYEGFISYDPPPPGPGGGGVVAGDFADIDAALAHNESELGLPAGSIEQIGKQDVGGGWTGDVFQNDPILTFSCSPDDASCDSFTVDFDPLVENINGVALENWTLVKIAIKIGNTGREDGDLSGHGIFLVEDGVLDGTPIVFDSSLLAAFQADIGLQTAISNVHFFGVGAGGRVPEPGTLALFGFGILALGVAARRRRKLH